MLPRGATLTAKHIETIKIWGIPAVDIEAADPREVGERLLDALPPSCIQEGTRRVDRRFAACGREHPFLEELYRIAVISTARALAAGNLPEPQRKTLPRRRGAPSGALPGPEVLIAGEVGLASFPDTYFRIVEVIGSPRSSAWHIADVVEKDTSLTAKLLKLVNSSFYNFPSRIESLPRAVALIGGNELSTVALGISAVSMFPEIPEAFATMKTVWRHAVATGVLGRIFALPHPEISSERIFVAGILHDIGRLVLLRRVPEEMTAALELELRENLPLWDAERRILGYDHARLGGLLLRRWQIPPVIENAVKWHHAPSVASTSLEPAALHLADVTAIALGEGLASDQLVPRLDEGAWRAMGAPEENLETMVAQAGRQIAEVLDMFLDGEEVAGMPRDGASRHPKEEP